MNHIMPECLENVFTDLRKELNVCNAENVWQADNSACIIL